MAETAASIPQISRLEYGRDPEGKELLVMRTLQSHERGKKHAGMERSGKPRDDDGIVPAPEALQPYLGTNTIVMMEWEKEYMEKLVEALNVQADDEVLEIGWGLGYSAAAIQRRRPRRHVIIECDTGVLERAKLWKESVEHSWRKEEQSARKESGSHNEGRPEEGESNKKQQTRETDSFERSIVLVHAFWQQALPSMDMFTAVLMDDFPLPLLGPEAENESRVLASTGGSRWHHFLDLVVSYHLRPGGRVTGYLSRDLDLCRADCTYTRCPVEVVVPTNCNYATPGRQTYFVPLLTRNRIGGEHQGGEEVGVAVGCSHIITGRARGDAAITAECYQNKRRKEDEWDEIDTPYMCKAARKRRCMLRHLLEAQKC